VGMVWFLGRNAVGKILFRGALNQAWLRPACCRPACGPSVRARTRSRNRSLGPCVAGESSWGGGHPLL